MEMNFTGIVFANRCKYVQNWWVGVWIIFYVVIPVMCVGGCKMREGLAVRKHTAQKFDGERFNLRKLKELEVKEKYQIEITKRFAALENLIVDEDVNRAWENIKENIKASAKESLDLHELKQHKPGFDKELAGF
jgi:hypothetical protein